MYYQFWSAHPINIHVQTYFKKLSKLKPDSELPNFDLDVDMDGVKMEHKPQVGKTALSFLSTLAAQWLVFCIVTTQATSLLLSV